MRRIVTWLSIAAAVVTVVMTAVIGFQILDGGKDFLLEARILWVSFGVLIACAFVKLMLNRCPHCGAVRFTNGEICPRCGRRYDERPAHSARR